MAAAPASDTRPVSVVVRSSNVECPPLMCYEVENTRYFGVGFELDDLTRDVGDLNQPTAFMSLIAEPLVIRHIWLADGWHALSVRELV